MKLSFLIPSKDGGDGFEKLLSSVRSNVAYAMLNGCNFVYEIVFIINGDSAKAQKYIDKLDKKSDTRVLYIEKPGKVSSINFILNTVNSDYIIILDDDVYFNENLLYLAIKEISKGLNIVSFQTRSLPYSGVNRFKKFVYDTLNIRSLQKLYVGVDPFLIGRFIFIKKDLFIVPDNIINEDLYLSMLYSGQFVIRPEEIYYVGESSILSHIKRVIRLETGRKQVRNIFGSVYDENLKRDARIIDHKKIGTLTTYNKFCYRSYVILRYITNSIIARFHQETQIFKSVGILVR